MALPEDLVTQFDTVVSNEAVANLVAANLIAQGPALTPGTSSVNRKKVKRFTGEARRGYKLRKVPRESAEHEDEFIQVVEHAYGFSFHRKELQAYQSHGFSVVDTQEAKESTRVVTKSLDDIILNGDSTHEVKGIYADAGDTFTVESDYEWNNAVNRNPEDTIIDAVGQFQESGIYSVKKEGFLALSPLAYTLARKRDRSGARYMDGIADIFGGIENVYEVPALAGDNGGLIGIKNTEFAERNVEEEVGVIEFELQPDSTYPFNIETYQATQVKDVNAFLKLANLVASA